MASDGPGKYKEKKSRSSKPYDRPKGIIRRVTDSVTGLFSTSWLSGWMAGEEEEEAGEPHAGSSQSRVTSQVNTMAPPGESFIFAQPTPMRRSFRPIYPEEGEMESNSQQSLEVNAGASTSSGVRMNLPTAASVGIPTAVSPPLNTEIPSPGLMGRRHPIISSTPTPMYNARTKSQLEPRSLPLLTSSTPTGDDGSEFSESSVDTGLEASVIPRPDEREYQREILQLDDESLQTLRETLAKSAPAAPVVQHTSALPSLEETRKRPRELESDQTSMRADGSISNKSLFSESGDISLSQPQPSALASKRPRFNVSTYGSPVMVDRSVLSDSSFKMSPFYPGKTMFGGASAYRRGRMQARKQTARVQVKPKPSQSTEDGGLSQSARRILECLEQMTTPISDAKRIPTPIPGQRGSFLDSASSYTAAYHRHRPAVRQTGPPTSKASTPIKVTRSAISSESSFTAGTSMSASATTSAAIPITVSSNSTSKEPMSLTSRVGTSLSKEGKSGPSVTTLKEDFSSSFSKAVAEATAKFKPSTPIIPAATSAVLNTLFDFTPPSNSPLPPFEFAPKPTEATAAFSSGSNKAGGKVKSKVVSSGRTSSKQNEEHHVLEEPNLPAISLTMPSLPKIDFTSTFSNSPLLAKTHTSVPGGFKFASPEVVHGKDMLPGVATNPPVFTFSSPAVIGRGDVNSLDSPAATPIPPVTMLFNSCSSNSTPKLKAVTKKDRSPAAVELKEGSILDILKPKRRIAASPEISPKENNTSVTSPGMFNRIDGKSKTLDSSFTKLDENILGVGLEQNSTTVNSVAKRTDSSQVFQGFSSFMKSTDEWECSVCMVRNKNLVEKCVACETSKPGLQSNSSNASSIQVNAVEDPPPIYSVVEGGWGNAFKKSVNEWECEMCMVRNKESSDKCVACETPKPGSKSEPFSQVSKVLESKEEKTNVGFGSMFVKAKGEWECDTCLVRNKGDASRCVSCETPKPGAVPVSQAITGNFKFGVNSNDSSTSSTFKFGVNDSQAAVKSSGGFTFGVSAKNTEESNRGSGGFKFGVSEEVKSNVLTGSSCGIAGVDSKENSEHVRSSSSGSSFVFGVKSSDKTKEAEGSKVPNFSFSSNKLTESKLETTNAVEGRLNFKAGGIDSFTFGGGLKRKSENKEKNGAAEVKPASELKSTSIVDILKESSSSAPKGVFTFGTKVETASKPMGEISAKSPSMFNNTLTQHKDTKAAESIVPRFGSATGTNQGPSLGFGSKPGVVTTTSNSFTFGGGEAAAATANVSNSFSFTSPANKEESNPVMVPPFTFGTKRGASDSEEPSKKITFGSPAPATLTNNVNAKPSLFNFGSTETMSPGMGFGAPPTSTPAFGAPAQTCNATGNFQFGHNKNPVPAATAPATAFGSAVSSPAFGGATAAFGSNNSTASFAFGQGAKKNVSAGFDFGQAATNSPGQGFNFAAGTAAPVFQFGQKQNDPPSGLFQFGSGSTGVEASVPSFGGENPFNTPAPPSGRVVKKARRRKQP